MEKDIFISFSNKDIQPVREIVRALKDCGVTCWFQEDDSMGIFSDRISEGIRNARGMVVFISPNSVSSTMVKNEVVMGINHHDEDQNYHVLPVVLPETQDSDLYPVLPLIASINRIYCSNYKNHHNLALSILNKLSISVSEISTGDSTYTALVDNEQKRLVSQSIILDRQIRPVFDSVFDDNPEMDILDIGCANGIAIGRKMAGRPYRTLLGVDKNEHLVSDAGLNFSDGRNTFLSADPMEQSGIDAIGSYMERHRITGFDLIHISFVLLHLGDPGQMLRAAGQLLKDGGTIVIQDMDDGANYNYPESRYFDDCYRIWTHCRDTGDRRMGRKLPGLLDQEGFRDIQVVSSSVTSLDENGHPDSNLWDMYFNTALWMGSEPEDFNDPRAMKWLEYCRQQHPDEQTRYLEGKLFINLGCVLVTAKK